MRYALGADSAGGAGASSAGGAGASTGSGAGSGAGVSAAAAGAATGQPPAPQPEVVPQEEQPVLQEEQPVLTVAQPVEQEEQPVEHEEQLGAGASHAEQLEQLLATSQAGLHLTRLQRTLTHFVLHGRQGRQRRPASASEAGASAIRPAMARSIM